MPKVFVHGNPETDAIWGPLVDSLSSHGVDDIILLSAPGFGVAPPPGWEPSPEAYASWLLDEIAAINGPVDLVGHDWGAGHVFGALAQQPEGVRSWAADCAGLLHPDYVWHDMAQVWQTPGAGEEAVAGAVAAAVEDRTAAYVGIGLPQDIARSMAEAYDAELGRCILGLYRGAAQPTLVELGRRVVAADLPPGLVIDATGDPYVATDLGVAVMNQLGAGHLQLEGNGHWWMTEDPDSAAAGLASFWAGL